ncbi:MAG: hypothetical protein MUF38_04815 [Anaerolineae bacterium]|jgi:hypothetical protein|nr:hypothetical protein [Anaerolineae bacterium]
MTSPRWRVPTRSLTLRWALIGVGIVAVVWTGPEDDPVWLASLIGVALTGLGLAHWLTGVTAGREWVGRQIAGAWAGFGALTGGLGCTTTVLLMGFKDARHAHPFPDYPPELLAALLERTPVWALVGALIGLGVYAAWRAKNT